MEGDIIRDPEIFPTGYNIYQFDPRVVPSEVAVERGNEIAKNTLDYYFQKYKKYPETVGLVLWGFETAKTHGETIGQILSYLGVKIKRGYDIWEPKLEIIPLSELKRPRIDCVITICGFFRDMFPNLIDLLDEIFETVSSLDEPLKMNFVKKHRLSLYNEMVKEMSELQAKELSTARIFGPPEGQYGTGITTMVEIGNWKEEVEIANAYISAQKHVYTRNRRGEAQKNLFEHNLKNIDLVSQVQSSADYSFSDLDHYYEYFGGLAKSVETAKGIAALFKKETYQRMADNVEDYLLNRATPEDATQKFMTGTTMAILPAPAFGKGLSKAKGLLSKSKNIQKLSKSLSQVSNKITKAGKNLVKDIIPDELPQRRALLYSQKKWGYSFVNKSDELSPEAQAYLYKSIQKEAGIKKFLEKETKKNNRVEGDN